MRGRLVPGLPIAIAARWVTPSALVCVTDVGPRQLLFAGRGAPPMATLGLGR